MSRRAKDQRHLSVIYVHRPGRVDEYKVSEKGKLVAPIASGSRRAPTPMRRAPVVFQPTSQIPQPESESETVTVLDIEELEPTPIDFRAWEPWNDFEFLLPQEPTGCYAGKWELLLD
jgi:hypothetical protein